MQISRLNQQRWQRFRHHRRGYWSLWIFLFIFVLSLCRAGCQRQAAAGALSAPLVRAPVFNYSETDFGGDFATAADYQDPGCNSGWKKRVGRSGHPFALEPIPSILRHRCLSLHLPRDKTGWVLTPTVATCWRGCCTVCVFRFCSVCCLRCFPASSVSSLAQYRATLAAEQI